MLFRLRLIIADPALFYVEESLKSLYQVRSPFIFFIHSMPKEYVNFPPWQSFFVSQPEVSPDLLLFFPHERKIPNSGRSRAMLWNSFYYSVSPVQSQGGDSEWAAEGRGHGCDTGAWGYSRPADQSCNGAVHLGGKFLYNTQPSPAKRPDQRWCAQPSFKGPWHEERVMMFKL